MNTMIELWYVWITILAIGIVIGFYIKKFINKPTFEQIESVKEWLVWACIEAERLWGSKTGAMKLREVYDWFISKFPAISSIISFNTFSSWVDDALEIAKHIMETNETVKNYVQ